jgi:hypothetical protein
MFPVSIGRFPVWHQHICAAVSTDRESDHEYCAVASGNGEWNQLSGWRFRLLRWRRRGGCIVNAEQRGKHLVHWLSRNQRCRHCQQRAQQPGVRRTSLYRGYSGPRRIHLLGLRTLPLSWAKSAQPLGGNWFDRRYASAEPDSHPRCVGLRYIDQFKCPAISPRQRWWRIDSRLDTSKYALSSFELISRLAKRTCCSLVAPVLSTRAIFFDSLARQRSPLTGLDAFSLHFLLRFAV